MKYNLNEIQKIESESKLETLFLQITDYKTGLVLEHMKAPEARQIEIKKELNEIKKIDDYLIKKLKYYTRSRI